MKEDDIVAQLLDEVAAATPSGVDVRTDGGDQDTSPPEVILRWNAPRLDNANGHNSFGGYIEDSNGDFIGIQHHVYHRFEAEFVMRYYDEIKRDQVASSIEMALLPYERNSEAFNKDTTEWSLGNISPRNNPVIEPDWYESSLFVSFKYVKRVDDTDYDTIEAVNDSVERDESLDDTTIDSN